MRQETKTRAADGLLVIGLGFLVWGGYSLSECAGHIVTGVAIMLLAVALQLGSRVE